MSTVGYDFTLSGSNDFVILPMDGWSSTQCSIQIYDMNSDAMDIEGTADRGVSNKEDADINWSPMSGTYEDQLDVPTLFESGNLSDTQGWVILTHFPITALKLTIASGNGPITGRVIQADHS